MTDTGQQHGQPGHAHGPWHGRGMGAMDDPQRYARFSGWVAGRLYRRVARDVTALGLPAGARVLDVGTGPGALPRLVAAANPGVRVDAVDLAPEMIAFAQRTATAGVTYAVADVAALPWPDGTFDLVVSTLSQHHWADPTAGLRELRRVLRPEGRAWVYDVRWALPQAHASAGALGSGTSVVREGRLSRTSWLNPVGRLVVRPT
ncbi:class I SAM-dependent methyltransferase [Cellulomonas sp. S1-8]|uniref:class I SAM-dependent methyltransferase n=1 Tax=Cellulomonas sp. S1-8 TaxID=2904790 RepID=UPI0022432458|nr:class I SAM-dependent methyltransferase [Cellulomonas sp. S1-8]UZN04353.1 class I SAM-dependent methyltransferase [Cellulomonas sp. S1-8]